MKVIFFLAILCGNLAFANTVDDMFVVQSINGKQATLKGAVKTLKAGDLLYFVREPYQFKIASTAKDSVVIELPVKHDLAVKSALLRNPTPIIQRHINDLKALDSALGE